MVSCPFSPRPRKPIHSDGMLSDSENHSPLSSQVLNYATEDTTMSELDKGSSDDENSVTGIRVRGEVKVKDTSATVGSCLRYIPESNVQNNTGSELQQSKNQLKMLLVIIGVLAILASWSFSCTQDTEQGLPLPNIKASEKEREQSLRKDIRHIRAEFPSQLDNIWVEFSAGIKETAQGTPTKPSVFLLLYETEEGTPICLAQKMGNISTHFLNAVKLHPLLIIQGADLQHNETLAEDYGVLLEEYRPKVEDQRTMIVNNLHKIPGTVAQSFHSFCDTVTPVVAKAVYFFTMKASGVTTNRDNPTAVAEEELRKLWSDKLDEDMLNPLITRITDTTMMIKPEKNLAPCES